MVAFNSTRITFAGKQIDAKIKTRVAVVVNRTRQKNTKSDTGRRRAYQ